jgi:hypothetical protein
LVTVRCYTPSFPANILNWAEKCVSKNTSTYCTKTSAVQNN